MLAGEKESSRPRQLKRPRIVIERKRGVNPIWITIIAVVGIAVAIVFAHHR